MTNNIASSPLDTCPSDHRIRLLLPFLFARNQQHAAASLLIALTHQTHKNWPCWERPNKIPNYYQEETLISIANYLVGENPGSCAYLKVPDDTANYWFKEGGSFNKVQSDITDKQNEEYKATLAKPGIELFLSPHGVGIFSVTFEPKQLNEFKDLIGFNYQLSQIRPRTSYYFSLPYTDNNREPRPASDAPLAERLGKAGGEFKLIEWVEFLLQPLKNLNYRSVQQQFNVYSVTRFNASVEFTQSETQTALRPLLLAFTHVEERNHSGSLQISEQRLSPRHWAAVGSLGAAHLVADQNIQPKGYDEHRANVSLHKYFIPYLISLMQRVILQGILEEGREILVSRCGDGFDDPDCWVEALRKLNRHTLAFTVNGWFTETSSREVLNQYYSLAQRGLRVQDSFQILQNALHDAEVMDNGRFQNDTLAEMGVLAKSANHSIGLVAHVQSKVEWLEVFFVSYYATALMYYINHDGELFSDDYSLGSLIAAPLVSGLIAFKGLSPHKLHDHHEQGQQDKTYWFLLVLAAVFGAWLAVGYLWFPHEASAPVESPHHSTTAHSESSSEASHP